MIGATLEKFGSPRSVVKEYGYWLVLLRPAQVTLGALILVEKSGAMRFSDLKPEAFAEYGRVVKEVEGVLSALFEYDRINHLMMMMVDPEVHFHVLPRYCTPRVFEGVVFRDEGWPGFPDLSPHSVLPVDVSTRLIAQLREAFCGIVVGDRERVESPDLCFNTIQDHQP